MQIHVDKLVPQGAALDPPVLDANVYIYTTLYYRMKLSVGTKQDIIAVYLINILKIYMYILNSNSNSNAKALLFAHGDMFMHVLMIIGGACSSV